MLKRKFEKHDPFFLPGNLFPTSFRRKLCENGEKKNEINAIISLIDEIFILKAYELSSDFKSELLGGLCGISLPVSVE